MYNLCIHSNTDQGNFFWLIVLKWTIQKELNFEFQNIVQMLSLFRALKIVGGSDLITR